MNNDRDYLHRQLIKLGDMMGDGLHYESDGKWISKEYKAISKQLFPEMYKDAAKKKSDSIDSRVAKVISENKCSCGGDLKQSRKGAKVLICESCPNKYKIKSKH